MCYIVLPASGTDLQIIEEAIPHNGGELFIFGNGNTHTNNHVKFRNRPERAKKQQQTFFLNKQNKPSVKPA
jgi:hypothetical protein